MAKYIYICSAGHSGSTLLDLLIGSHSKAASLGEISQFPKNIALNTLCTCGNEVRSCKLWQEIIQALSYQFGVDILKNPYLLNLGYFKATTVVDRLHATRRYELKRITTRAINYANLRFGTELFSPLLSRVHDGVKNKILLYDLVAAALGVDKVVDSSKDYLDAINLYKATPEQVRIILLMRDGKAVYYSGLKKGFSNTSALNAWKRYYSRAIPLLKKNVKKNHIFFIKYEDLVLNTTYELEKLCKFIGLDYEKTAINFSKKVHHITNGNNMRFAESSEIKLDNTWKKMLSVSESYFFDKKAGKLNRQFGYK
jgi:hypothetical protein